MTAKGICIVGIVATCIALLAVPAAAEPVRVWGTCSAVLSQNPRFQNEWEYTIDIGWDTTGWEPEHLEQVGLFLDLASCPCVGAPTFFAFPYTNGVGTGKDGGVTRYYYAGYSLPQGSLRFATQSPAVVFEYLDTGSVLNVQGTARFVFVSTSRPGERRACPDGIGIAVGPNEARGEITGVFPSCDCGNTPVEPATTWGTIKAMFK